MSLRCFRARFQVPATSSRSFSTSASARARRSVVHGAKVMLPTESELTATPEEEVEDTTWAGHMALDQQRTELYYMRLIEHEMPKLVAFRKPFEPPTNTTPLIVRSVDYLGEKHPVAPKRAVVVPVARLPLNGRAARHKFKLLAGVRWTVESPKDAGVSMQEGHHEHGFFKMSCEDFPKAAMNLKFISDTIDRLVEEANDTSKESFSDIPLDTRHMDSRSRKAKKGAHGRLGRRPTIHDFPKEWLPSAPSGTVRHA